MLLLKTNSVPEKYFEPSVFIASTVNFSNDVIVEPERVAAFGCVENAMEFASIDDEGIYSSSEHEVIRPSARAESNKNFFIKISLG